MRNLIWISCIVLISACGGSGSGSGDSDAGLDGSAGACPVPCDETQVCRYNNCVPTPTPCSTTDDCQGDFYCDLPAGECLPWGVGPGGDSDDSCTRDVVAGVFFPDVQCEWLGPPPGDPYPDHVNVLGTPMVADFRTSSDPEIRRPSIVFISYNHTDGGQESCQGVTAGFTGVIRVLDGRTCEQQANIASPLPIPSSALALGDLTGDGIPEIIAARAGGGLATWKKASGGQFELNWESTSTFGGGTCNWAGPSIHDLDDDGSPEIMLYGAVFDAAGNELTSALGTLNGVLGQGYIPVVADVDADGVPELITGTGYYGWIALTQSWDFEGALDSAEGHIAVADFGTYGAIAADDDRSMLDGVAEVVSVRSGVLRVFTLGGREIYSGTLPGGGFGGPPTVADFDGDGRVEAAGAGLGAYTVFDPDCLGTPDVASCPSMNTNGILWTRVSQDGSSSKTGSSVFDFEGDGTAEAVYGDECFTRVYEGATGDVVYSRFRTSCTWYENPVIVDADADFGAEIIIASNTNCNIGCPAVDPIFDGVRCFDESDCPNTTTCVREVAGDEVGRCRCTLDADCGGDSFVCVDPIAGPSAMGKVCRAGHGGMSTAKGVRVVGDQLGRWVATRPVWNQHAYAVTNIGDGGRVPRTSERVRNWQMIGLNNFRQNSPGEGAGAGRMPDMTIRQSKFGCRPTGEADITVEVCNRGTLPVGDGIPVAVYDGTTLVCTAVTVGVIRPGLCESVTCTWDMPPSAGVDLNAVVDDDGTGKSRHTECREGNNSTTVTGVGC